MSGITLEAFKAAIVLSATPDEFLLNLKALLESPLSCPSLPIGDDDATDGVWGLSVAWNDNRNNKIYMDLAVSPTKAGRVYSLHLFNWSFARVLADSKIASVGAWHVQNGIEAGQGFLESQCLLPRAWFRHWPTGVSSGPQGLLRLRFAASPEPSVALAFTATRDAIARTKICYFLLQFVKQSQTAAAADQFFARVHLKRKRIGDEPPQVTVRRLYRQSLSVFSTLLDDTATSAQCLRALMAANPTALKESVVYNAELLRTEIGVAARKQDVYPAETLALVRRWLTPGTRGFAS